MVSALPLLDRSTVEYIMRISSPRPYGSEFRWRQIFQKHIYEKTLTFYISPPPPSFWKASIKFNINPICWRRQPYAIVLLECIKCVRKCNCHISHDKFIYFAFFWYSMAVSIFKRAPQYFQSEKQNSLACMLENKISFEKGLIINSYRYKLFK